MLSCLEDTYLPIPQNIADKFFPGKGDEAKMIELTNRCLDEFQAVMMKLEDTDLGITAEHLHRMQFDN